MDTSYLDAEVLFATFLRLVKSNAGGQWRILLNTTGQKYPDQFRNYLDALVAGNRSDEIVDLIATICTNTDCSIDEFSQIYEQLFDTKLRDGKLINS